MKPDKWGILKPFIGRHISIVVLVLFAGLVSNMLTIAIPVSIGKYYDLLFDYHSHRAAVLNFLPGNWFDTIPHFLAFFFVLVSARTIAVFIERFYTGKLGELMVKEVREILFEHQLSIKTANYKNGMGKYLLRYSGDLKSLQSYVTRGMIRFTSDILLLSIAVSVLFWLDWMATNIMMVGVIIVVCVVYLLNNWLYNVSVKRRNTRSSLLAFVNERLGALISVKTFNKEATEQQKFEKRSSKLYESGVEYQAVYNAIFSLIPGLLYASLGIALWLISKQEKSGLDEGKLLAFILLFITVIPAFRRILRVPSTWKVGNISIEKLLRVLHLSSEKDWRNKAKYNYKGGEIETINVGFGYDEETVFSNLNLHIKPKTTCLIKLESGYGKTTLIKMLAGIYEPEVGDIKVDGQTVSSIDLKSLRRHLTVVGEEFQLFGRTVFEAISYSRKEEKRPLAQTMLDLLQKDMNERNKLKLDDKIGELGVHLSQSQRKILQYARALLTNKPILIIESPFKGLSPKVEENISEILTRRKRESTIVIFDSTSEINIRVDEVIEI